MKKLLPLGVLSVVAVAIGGGVVLGGAPGSGEAKEDRGVVNAANAAPRKVVDERVRSAHVLVASGGKRRIVGPASLCAPNDEAISLVCAGRVRAPAGLKLQVRPGKAVSLRFGTSVERVTLRYERATKDGRVIALTYPMPLRASSKSGLSWSTAMSRDPALHRARRLIAVLSVAYRDAVSLPLPTRMSRPFTDATAEFAVPLAVVRDVRVR